MGDGTTGSEHGPSADFEHEEAVLEAVRSAISAIDFGSVLIKIHQGEVVGIETSTKLRLKGPDKAS